MVLINFHVAIESVYSKIKSPDTGNLTAYLIFGNSMRALMVEMTEATFKDQWSAHDSIYSVF